MSDTKDVVVLGKTHVVVRGACGAPPNGNAFTDGRDRASEITEATSAVVAEITRLRATNAELVEALRFYACEDGSGKDFWVVDEGREIIESVHAIGHRARSALARNEVKP